MTNQNGFTPKEKATDLIEKINKSLADGKGRHITTPEDAKNLALLFCAEVIAYEFFGSHTQEYWKSVKKELEKRNK